MKIVATVGPVDEYACRKVRFEIEEGGNMRTARTYLAGTLYLQEPHVEPILRSLEGASGGFVGDLEVHHGNVK